MRMSVATGKAGNYVVGAESRGQLALEHSLLYGSGRSALSTPSVPRLLRRPQYRRCLNFQPDRNCVTWLHEIAVTALAARVGMRTTHQEVTELSLKIQVHQWTL
jgi:hypothetical protein